MKTFTFCSRAGSAASRCGWWWKCSSLWHGCSAAAGGVGKHTSSHTVHEQLGDTSNPPWVQQWGHSGQWAVCCAAGYPACAKEAEMKASGIRGLPPAVRRTQRCWGTVELLAHFLAHLLAPAALHQQPHFTPPRAALSPCYFQQLGYLFPEPGPAQEAQCAAQHCTLGHVFEVHQFTSLQYHMLSPVLRFYVANSRGFREAALDLHHLRGEEKNDTEVQSQLMIASLLSQHCRCD